MSGVLGGRRPAGRGSPAFWVVSFSRLPDGTLPACYTQDSGRAVPGALLGSTCEMWRVFSGSSLQRGRRFLRACDHVPTCT